jgi:5,10-methylenetetrahydromethanopterin reductase
MQEMNMGIGFLAERLRVPEKVFYAQMAEKCGFASAWAAEHYFHRDAIVTASAILSSTSKLKVGTGVVNPYTRHPALLAMAAATLGEMSGGRFVLGMGSSVRSWIEDQMSMQFGDPASALLEAFTIVRKMLDGKKTVVAGKRFAVKGAKMEFQTDLTRIPVYLAAVGPKMLTKSAELSDGVVLSTGSTPHYIRWAMPHIRNGLGRSKKREFGVVCLVALGVRRDPGRAREEMMPWLLTPLLRPGRAKLVLPDETAVSDAQRAWAAGDMKGAARKVPDEVLESVCISGDVEECVRGVEKYRGLGVTDLVLVPISFEKDLLAKLLKRLS